MNPEEVRFIYRQDVKLHLCKTAQAKDANIRRAAVDMFPGTGGGKEHRRSARSRPQVPLAGVSSHAWSALAAAVTTNTRWERTTPDTYELQHADVEQPKLHDGECATQRLAAARGEGMEADTAEPCRDADLEHGGVVAGEAVSATAILTVNGRAPGGRLTRCVAS